MLLDGITKFNSAALGKNIVIGGDFGTNPWQRGTTFNSISNVQVAADYWRYFRSGGTFSHNVFKITDAPTVAQAGALITNSMSIEVGTAQASLAINEFASIDHNIEGYNFRRIAQKTFTLSFWVKATATGVYSVGFINNGGDRSYVSTYTVNSVNTWEFKTITVTPSPSAGTWNYTNDGGLRVRFTLGGNSSSAPATSSLNQWLTGNFQWSTTQVNSMATASNVVRFANIQIEEGAQATQFAVRSIQQELSLCQRYFYRWLPPLRGVCGPEGTTAHRCACSLPTSMRANPTLSYTGTLSFYDGNNLRQVTSVVNSWTTTHSIEMDFNLSGAVTTGRAAVLYQDGNGGYIDIMSEL